MKNVITKYERLLSIILQSVQDLQRGNIPDPTIVGDSACQFRAGMFCEMLSRPNLNDELSVVESKLLEVIDRINRLDWRQLSKTKENVSLREFLAQRELDVVIPRRFQVLALASLLTRVQETLPLACEPDEEGKVRLVSLRDKALPVDKKIQGITPSFGKDLLAMAKIRLSKFSVQYIRNSASCLGDPQLLEWVNGDFLRETTGGVPAVPCFAGMEILFRRALLKGTPVVLNVIRINDQTGEQVDKGSLLFVPNQRRSDFVVCDDACPALMQQSAIVIEGVCMGAPLANNGLELEESLSDFQQRLSRQSLMELILADGAVHSQYPAGVKNSPYDAIDSSAILLSNFRRQQYEQIALNKGLSPANSSTCRIYHIKCGMVNNSWRP